MLNVEVLDLELSSGQHISQLINTNDGIILFIIPKFVNVTAHIELKFIQEVYLEFKKLNWEVLVVTIEDHLIVQEFVKKNNLQFPIYFDHDLKLAKALDIIGDQHQPLTRTIVIDQKHYVKKIFKQIIPKEHPREVLKWIQLNDLETINMLEKGMSIQ